MRKFTGICFIFSFVTSLVFPAMTMAATEVDCSGIKDQQIDYEIHDIQGSGNSSPLEAEEVTTCGTVTATHSSGYWMQDTTEDGDPATSEGIYVYLSNGLDGIKAGDVVRQTGKVKEYYDLTELSARRGPKVIGTSTIPSATEITDTMSYDNLESLEGMNVTVKRATVVAGSNKYNETFLVPGSTTTRVDRKDTTTPYFKIDDKLGNYITGASTFDTISGDPTGPLDYSFGAYTLQWNSGSVSLSDDGHTENVMSSDTSSELTVNSFNVENYFAVGSEVSPGDSSTEVTQEEFDTKTAKLSLAIRQNLGAPDILALQEVEKMEVLDALVAQIESDGGPHYTPYLIEGNDSRGIDVAYLVKDGINELNVKQIGKNATTSESGCGPSGTNLLFSRPPLILQVKTDEGEKISIINNHFKSKAGSDACRNAQATFVADAANNESANGFEVIVTGDLNSFEDEQSVNIIESKANLTNLIYDIPAENAFSYIYTGKAQFLDHMLVSSNLVKNVSNTNSAKMNPDFAISNETDPTTALHVSDHDPIHAVFNYGTSTDETTTSNDGSTNGMLLISEVYYDTSGTDSEEEYVEVYNGTDSRIDLSGYTLQDNYESFALPSGTSIDPGQHLVIAKDAAGFKALFGMDPDVSGMTIALSNSGDQVILKDGSGTEVDFVAYEGYVAGWDIKATTGDAIYRMDVTKDGDTVDDWSISAPTPKE